MAQEFCPNPLIVTAVQYLAGRCDYAQTLDGIGYSASDAAFGHALAELPGPFWNAEIEIEAFEMLRKYRTQLGPLGFTYAEIAKPEGQALGYERTALVKDAKRALEYTVEFHQDLFCVKTPYNPTIVQEIKSIPGRRWDGNARCWSIPNTPKSARALVAFIDSHRFVVAPDVDLLLRTTAAVVEVPQATTVAIVSRHVTMDNGQFVLRFDYDPGAVAWVKNTLVGRRWDATQKCWTAPASKDNIIALTALVTGGGWTVDGGSAALLALGDEYEQERMVNAVASRAESAEPLPLVLPEGLDVRPYQWAGARYLVNNERVILGDEPGLGKTIMAILGGLKVAQAGDALLFVVPASVKLNWAVEIHKWAPLWRVEVLSGTRPHTWDTFTDAVTAVIINWDLLGAWQETLAQVPWRVVVGDEAHRARTTSAVRSQAFKALCKLAPYRWLLTGTATDNKASEFSNLLDCVGRRDELFGTYPGFARACGGYIEEIYTKKKVIRKWTFPLDVPIPKINALNAKLREGGAYIRRERSAVLKELPATQRQVLPVSITNAALYNRAANDLSAYLRAEYGPEEGAKKSTAAARAGAMALITVLRQLSGVGKVEAAVEWATDFLASGQKLLVFAWYREVQDALYQALAKDGHEQGYAVVAITGDTTTAQRQAKVKQFQDDPKTRVAVLSIAAAGEGITLTAASTSLNVETDWTPGRIEQTEARMNRFGQKAQAVHAVYLQGAGTIDEMVWELVQLKAQVTRAANSGDAVATTALTNQNLSAAVLERLLTNAGLRAPERIPTDASPTGTPPGTD